MLTSRSYPFILLLFPFCSGCPTSGSLLGLVRLLVLVFTVVLLYLEFKFSQKLSN